MSIGTTWRASMMAHSARDPYWQAGVRREVTDHPQRAGGDRERMLAAATCRWRTLKRSAEAGGSPSSPTFHRRARPPPSIRSPSKASPARCVIRSRATDSAEGQLHRRLRDRDGAAGARPTDVRARTRSSLARASVMRSATGLQPTASTHIQRSELCATCHTLYTHALNAPGEAIERAPGADALPGMAAQRVPRHAELPVLPHAGGRRSRCRSPRCSGKPREGVSRHDFRGANFFMLGILNRFRPSWASWRDPRSSMRPSCGRKRFLQSSSASLSVERERDRRRSAGRRRPRAQPGGPQAADRRIRRDAPGCTSSFATARGASCSRRAASRRRARSPATTTTGTPPASSRTTARSARPTRCRSTRRSWAQHGPVTTGLLSAVSYSRQPSSSGVDSTSTCPLSCRPGDALASRLPAARRAYSTRGARASRRAGTATLSGGTGRLQARAAAIVH